MRGTVEAWIYGWTAFFRTVDHGDVDNVSSAWVVALLLTIVTSLVCAVIPKTVGVSKALCFVFFLEIMTGICNSIGI